MDFLLDDDHSDPVWKEWVDEAQANAPGDGIVAQDVLILKASDGRLQR